MGEAGAASGLATVLTRLGLLASVRRPAARDHSAGRVDGTQPRRCHCGGAVKFEVNLESGVMFVCAGHGPERLSPGHK